MADKFVITSSGRIGPYEGVLNVEKAVVALGKICRFAGNVKQFYSVLAHSLVVCDLAPERIKLLALVHDLSETAISDVPSPFKVIQLEAIEHRIQQRLYSSLGLNPTVTDFEDLAIADRRALLGEVWTVAEDGLRDIYTSRDKEAEQLTLLYSVMTPEDSICPDGLLVRKFIKTFKKLSQCVEANG